jgi:hypothetical protein
MLNREQKAVKALFNDLMREERKQFPLPREKVDAPARQGVYVIYSPRVWKVVHVGKTFEGTEGLRKRLRNHMHGSSAFAREFLDGKGSKLRYGYAFRCLPVASPRLRALLEAYAIGHLCPTHTGPDELGPSRNKRSS